MKFTTKEALLAQYDVGPKILEVALPNGTGYVREMTAYERTRFENLVSGKDGDKNRIRELLVVTCACDENGVRLFDDKDAAAVGQLPASMLEPYVTQAQIANDFSAATSEEVKKN